MFMLKSSATRLAAVCLAALPAFVFAQSDLRDGFKNPPSSAKARTWWHWINGNITKAGITADLEAMKRFGLGGAQIFNVDVGIPAGKKPFMSPQWKDALAWAFHEAKRLGLELDIHNCAGWSSSGGPWVKPEHAMQFLTWSETKVHSTGHVEETLPQPAKRLNYYGDIVCYAVRTPSDDKFRLSGIREKAAFERGDRIHPDAQGVPDDAVISSDDVRTVPMAPDGRVSVDLPEGDWTLIRMGHTPTGAQNEPSPASGLGPEVDKLSREAMNEFWSGMMATALKANGRVSKAGLIGALIDSYEVGSQNWTPKFREEFKKRRGYDPMPYLVTVTGRVVKSGEATERFLWDLRRTVCDLFADNYYGYMAELCHEHGLRFCTEGYGNGSFDNLQVSGLPDLPMAEFWIGGGARETTKMVASSAHTHGKPIIGAESFTADDQHAKWLYDPYAIKALGDEMFSFGINRYIFHRYAHQPWLNLEPGMTMGPWGTNFDRTITWWDQGRAWMKYVARCQYLLQSGRFVADVLAFEGDDGPNDMGLMRGTTIPEGYDYDGCDAKVLQSAHVEGGQVVLPSGMRYRVLMLPDSTWMTVKTAEKIQELVNAGAKVIGPKPLKSPSLAEAGNGDQIVRRIGDRLWDSGKVVQGKTVAQVIQGMRLPKDVASTKPLNWIHRLVGNDDVYFVANPTYQPIDVDVTFRVHGKRPELWNPETGRTESAAVWHATGGRTSVSLRLESAGSTFVVFHRGTAQQHLTAAKWLGTVAPEAKPPKVEVVEARYEAVDGSGGVDVTEKARRIVDSGAPALNANNANFGDPTVNHVKRLHVVYTVDGKRHEANIEENGSLDLVPAGADSVRPYVSFADGKALLWRRGRFELDYAGGRKQVVSSRPSEVALTRAWHLTFPPHLGAPRSATFPDLISWPDSKIEGIKYFSGSATYRTTFSYRGMKAGSSYWLDLGKVKNFAGVTLNGHSLPTLWKAPFRLDVSRWLKEGENSLEVKVTNLWPNRLIGDEQYPPEAKYNGPIQAWPDWIKNGTPRPPTKRVTFTTWQFFRKDSPLLESGLIGPVKILRIPTLDVSR